MVTEQTTTPQQPEAPQEQPATLEPTPESNPAPEPAARSESEPTYGSKTGGASSKEESDKIHSYEEQISPPKRKGKKGEEIEVTIWTYLGGGLR